MASAQLQVRIRLRWWLPLYIKSVCLFCELFGTAPDMEKVDRMLARGIYAEFDR